MSLDLHTVELLSPAEPAREDRILVGMQIGVASAAGAAAGDAVVTAIEFSDPLPAEYAVVVNPGQDATWFVSGKTANGFNVTLNPRLATNQLAAGAIDVMVFA